MVDGSHASPDLARLGARHLRAPEHRGLPEARNAGVRAATGAVCLFLDDDVVPDNRLVERLVDAYARHPDAGGVGAITLEARPPSRPRLFFVNLFQRGPFAHPVTMRPREGETRFRRVVRLSGAAQSYRRDLLLRQRFDENLRGYALGEDMDLSWRIAQEAPLYLAPGARVVHLGLGWSAGDLPSRFERKVYGYAYHYLKNLRRKAGHRARFAWLVLGILSEAGFYSALGRSLAPLRAVVRALRRMRTGLDGAGGFIDKDPRRLDAPAAVSRAEPPVGDRVR